MNTVGYCIGGTLLSSALGHMAKTGDDRIKSATFFASQSDFSLAGDLKVFTDDNGRGYIDSIIEEHNGIMPGSMMYETFNWLRPIDLVWRYVIDQYMLGKEPRPFDLLYWNADQTNILARCTENTSRIATPRTSWRAANSRFWARRSTSNR